MVGDKYYFETIEWTPIPEETYRGYFTITHRNGSKMYFSSDRVKVYSNYVEVVSDSVGQNERGGPVLKRG